MANTIVLGMQWGDEGKGKVVDLICPAFDAVARYQGGHNAGHTVKFADRHFSLHLIPSGALFPGMRCVLGGGMVIAPDALFHELDSLAEAGIDLTGRLEISDRAQVILPLHAQLDQAREAARGDRKIGTTARGIGPAYEMKAARSGLRTGELLAADLEDRLQAIFQRAEAELRYLGQDLEGEPAAMAAQCRVWGERLAPFLRHTAAELGRRMDGGEGVLFEGAQGALLDLDHGTYPYVTSSSALAGGVCTGLGVPPTRIDGVLGVIKAYTTRVGEGPFPTELTDALGEHLRQRGNEYGTTTGRPRRCGWFDAVAARYAQQLNGTGAVALTKLDVLDELEEVAVCVGYRAGGEVTHDFPGSLEVLAAAEPVYRRFPGWRQQTAGASGLEALPKAARRYIDFLEEQIGAPICIVSSGPRREETIVLDHPALTRLVDGRLERILRHRDAA